MIKLVFILIGALVVALFLFIVNLIIGGGLIEAVGGVWSLVLTCCGTGALLGKVIEEKFE